MRYEHLTFSLVLVLGLSKFSLGKWCLIWKPKVELVSARWRDAGEEKSGKNIPDKERVHVSPGVKRKPGMEVLRIANWICGILECRRTWYKMRLKRWQACIPEGQGSYMRDLDLRQLEATEGFKAVKEDDRFARKINFLAAFRKVDWRGEERALRDRRYGLPQTKLRNVCLGKTWNELRNYEIKMYVSSYVLFQP